jgi:hypothetical protein
VRIWRAVWWTSVAINVASVLINGDAAFRFKGANSLGQIPAALAVISFLGLVWLLSHERRPRT